MEFDLNRRPFLSFLKIQYFLLHMLLITLLGKKCFVAFFLIARIGLWLLVRDQKKWIINNKYFLAEM